METINQLVQDTTAVALLLGGVFLNNLPVGIGGEQAAKPCGLRRTRLGSQKGSGARDNGHENEKPGHRRGESFRFGAAGNGWLSHPATS